MFSALKNILKIMAWFTDRWASFKKKFKAWRLRSYENKVDNAIDNHDVGAISDIMRDIKEKRAKRRDGSR